jgi:ectoine hydroxylase-related dioxygenase (phytanoyl-CoA dioxygenase family)
MPAGSIMFFLSTLWHGGGQNTSGESRLAVTVQYCQPWVRPMENQLLAVDWEKLDGIHPRIVAMMGYKVGMPFIGYVDGRSPRTRVAELLDRWSRQAKL